MQPSQDITLAQASASYLVGLPPERRALEQGELNKFIRWCGSDRPVASISVHNAASYAETASAWGGDVTQRLEPVRSFLFFLKQKKLTSVNLAIHLKWRKGQARAPVAPKKRPPKTAPAPLTPEGHAQIEAELAALKAGRPGLAEELRHAAADKDFRENAPLDAARERQGHVEGRIRDLEAVLHSHHLALGGSTDVVAAHIDLGSRLVLRDLDRGGEMRCTLVVPAEASPRGGKLSITSPLGRALMDKDTGDEVEVAAPAGKFRYHIESVEN